MSLLKQPLLHFLLLGALIFVIYEWRGGAVLIADSDSVVSRNSFIEFIQYRNRSLDKSSAEKRIQQMSANEKNTFIRQHITEELLYREAVALGLQDKDYVIKQRLIQKMEYLLADTTVAEGALTRRAVTDYYEQNKQRYVSPATITFAQVFISSSDDELQTITMAEHLKIQLKQKKVAFEQAARYGDRFVYFSHYVERGANLVASHFGQDFADTLFSDHFLSSADLSQWQGPIASDYGQHLVMMAQYKREYIPLLATIYKQVEEDLRQSLLNSQLERNIQLLMKHYAIDVPFLEKQL